MFRMNWRGWLTRTFKTLHSGKRAARRRPPPRARLTLEPLEGRTVPAAISVTKAVDLSTAHPGDTLTYTVAITNNSPTADQTNVQFLDSVDPNTTFVSNSVKLSPMAVEHAFNAVGNTPLSGSLTTGVHDLDGVTPDAGLVYSGPATTAHGTLSVQSNGSFTYTPITGVQNTTDSFVYTVTDGDGLSSTNTVTINIGARVWYVDNTASSGGDGSFNSRFNSLADVSGAAGPDTAGDIIYVFSTGTAYDGNMTLLNNEQLIGGGVALTVNGVTVEPAGTNTALTTTAAGTDAITLASGNTVKGFTVGNTTGFKIINSSGASVGTATVSNVTLQGTGGDVSIGNGGTLAMTFDSLGSTGSTNAVVLAGAGGTFTANAGAISGATGDAFTINGGTVSASYAGTITGTAAHSVHILSATGGTDTFSGAISDSGTGILLTNNSGATINFTGGLSLSTGANAAFTATGGGTVSATQNNTSVVNTITTTSGTALDVANTTIGASGLTFRSISAGTGAGSAGDGILLDTTGTSGGLTVTGNGSAGSGGTIQHKTGADNSTTAGIGIYLNSTKNVSLTDMDLHDFGNYAIRGNNVNGFTLSGSTINGTNGTNSSLGDPNNEGSVRFDNLTGSALIQGSTIGSDSTTGGAYNAIQILNGSGTTLNQLDIENSNLYNNNISQGANAGNKVMLFGSASGSNAIMTLTVNNSHFGFVSGVSASTGARGELLQVNALGTSVLSATVTNNSFTDWGNNLSGSAALDISGGGTGNNVSISCNVDNNTFSTGTNFSGGAAVNVTVVGGAGTIYGKITNNQIGTATANSGTGQASADGIAIDVEGNNGSSGTTGALTGPSRFLVQGNTIQQYGEAGLKIDGVNGSATVNATVFGNTIENPQGGPGGGFQTAFAGIWVFAGANAGDTNTVNVVIGDANVAANQNTLTGSDPNGVNDVFLENDAAPATAHLNLSKNGSTATTANQVIIDDNIVPAGEAEADSGTITLVTTLPATPPLLAAPTGGVTAPAGVSLPATGTVHTPSGPGTVVPGGTVVTAAPAGLATAALSQDQLNAIVAAALQRWEATGLTAAQVDALQSDTYRVSTTLPSGYLGAEMPGQVVVSADGGGYGWYVDPTPLDDAEFGDAASATRLYTNSGEAPAGHFDLLTTVMHEMGHVLGLDDYYDPARRGDLMFGYLTFGERRLPAPGEAAGAVPGNQTGTDFLGLPTTIGTLAAGTTIHATFQVTINIGTSANSVSNTGEVQADGPIDVFSNTVTTTVLHQADLELSASALTTSPVEGGNIVYSVSLLNDGGPDAATNVVLTDVLPAGLTFVSSTGLGTASVSGGTVTWNLGNIGPNVTVSGTVTVTATEEGPYANPFSVTTGASDFDSSPNDESVTVNSTAAEQAVVVTASASAFSATEGTLSAAQTLATFTDPGDPTGTVEPSTDYTVEVDWGDGSGFVSNDPNVSVSASGGTYTVTGKHLYADEDGVASAIQVRVVHETTTSNTGSVSLNLTDPQIQNATGGFTFSATEGTLSAVQTLATFTDPGDPTGTVETAASDYTLLVDWGNGTFVSDPNLALSFSGGTLTVSGKHLYADEDGFTGPVRVSIQHEGNAAVIVSDTLSLTDPQIQNATGGFTFSATEGTLSAVQTLATFTDPGDPTGTVETAASDYTLLVDWGDGNLVSDANVTLSFSGGTYTVSGRHNYADEDGFPGPVRVSIQHEGNAAVIVSDTLSLTDPAPSVTAATGPFTATEGAMSAVQTLATFTDPGDPTGTVEPAADYTVQVDWGDGAGFVSNDPNVTVTLSGGTFTVTGKHQYTDENGLASQVQVRVVHETTTSNTAGVNLTVVDPNVSASAGPAVTVQEGVSTGTVLLATFTDPGDPTATVEPLADYSADIDWGDGAGFINGAGTISLSGTTYQVKASHTYATEDGVAAAIQVRINHEATIPQTVSVPLTITEPPVITSAASTTFTAGAPNSFTVQTDAAPTASLSESGALPGGVSFTDNHDGTATLSGTPNGGTGGTYAFTITATNGIAPPATQPFTLTVDEAPTTTSANSTTFTATIPGSFTVTTGHSFPAPPALSEAGALPGGVSFTDNHDGTATLSGTPAAGSNGVYHLTITASNGVAPNGVQSFTLVVGGLDFGSAPDGAQFPPPNTYPTLLAHDGARHVIGALRLGNTVTATPDGQPNATAADADADGVTFLSPLVANGTAAVRVNVQGAPAGGARLDGWVDFRHDGTWADAGDQVFTSVLVSNGDNVLTFAVPASAAVPSATFTFARFRLSTAGGLAPTGLANDGEVEDYRVTLSPAPSTVYVNPAFTGTPGTDPDGGGPATAVGFDAFATIQQALNVVAASGRVNVAAGTYAESLTLARSVTVQGAGSATTVLAGQNTGVGLDLTTANGVALAGLTVKGYHTGLLAGPATTYLSLTDVHLRGNAFGADINGVGTLLFAGGGGNDTFFVSPTTLAQPGDNPLGYRGVRSLTVDGGGGSNRLEVFLTDQNTPDTVWLTGLALARDRAPFLLWYRASGGSFAGGIAVVLGGEADTVVVQGQLAGAPTTVYGQGGDNTFFVALTSASGYAGLTLDGGSGNSALAVFDLSGGASLRNVVSVVGQGRVEATYPGGAVSEILYQNMEQILGDLPTTSG